MQQYRTEAIILRRTNYGEADRILNLLTPNHGKVSAIAKAVRRPKSKLAGGLELFAVCDVTILHGKSDMGVITSARIKVFYGDILHDYYRMQLGYEVVKQINTATQTVSDPAFYALLHDSLMYLGDLKIDWRLVELWFGLHLRDLLGNPINLQTDHNDQPLSPDRTYRYDGTTGTFYDHPSGQLDADHIKFLRLIATKAPVVVSRVGGIDKLNWAVLAQVLTVQYREGS